MEQSLTNEVEGNRSIAEFDGWEFKENFDGLIEAYYDGACQWVDNKRFLNHILTSEHGFSYNSNWNKLMPVVEKIEKDCKGEVIIYHCCCDIGVYPDGFDTSNTISSVCYPQAKSKIEATWLAVTQFLKWYKNQINIDKK